MKRRISLPVMVTVVFALSIVASPVVAVADDSTIKSDTSESQRVDDESRSDDEDSQVLMQDMLLDDDEETTQHSLRSETLEARADRRDRGNWAWVVGRSALAGGITGGLIGVGVTLATDRAFEVMYIGQFVGIGILAGVGLGLLELLVRGGDATSDHNATPKRLDADPPPSLEWMEHEMPNTHSVGGVRIDF